MAATANTLRHTCNAYVLPVGQSLLPTAQPANQQKAELGNSCEHTEKPVERGPSRMESQGQNGYSQLSTDGLVAITTALSSASACFAVQSPTSFSALKLMFVSFAEKYETVVDSK